MLSAWWVWLIFGIVLLVLSTFSAEAILLGFALGALALSLALLVGGPFDMIVDGSVPFTLLIFAGLSLIAWLIVRRVLGIRRGQLKIWDRDINDD